MRIQSFKAVLFSVVAFGVVAAAVQASPSDYTFTNIIDSTSGYTDFTAPAINNRGQVAFAASKGPTNQYILRAQPGVVTIIDHSVPGSDEVMGTNSINDSGVVAYSRFGRTDVSVAGEYIGDGNSVTTIAEQRLGGPPSGFTLSLFGADAINNNGTVIFGAQGAAGIGVYAYKNGQITPAVSEPAFLGVMYGVLNDKDQVVFNGFRKSDGLVGLFKVNASGGTPALVVDQKNFASDAIFSDYSVNNAGRVAFLSQRPNATTIGVSDGGPINILVQGATSGQPFIGVFAPSINDNNEVAFEGAYHQNGIDGTAIYSGTDLNTDRIIGTGAPLFGSTVSGVAFSSGGLNDLGQIVFTYFLEDGSMGFALATPRSIPEPAIVSGLAGVFLSLYPRRPKRTTRYG